MKLKDQVTSLELSKRLKELGVKQESYFKYCGGHTMYYDSDEGEYEECPNPDLLDPLDEYCHTAELTTEFTVAAFTVAELGEMLPKWIYTTKDSDKNDNFYCWADGENDAPETLYEGIEPIHADTEADARAKMLIYLLEQKLIVL